MRKLTYYIMRKKGQDQRNLILHDQEIVERYKSKLRERIKTTDINISDAYILKKLEEQDLVKITGDLIKQKRLEKGLTQLEVVIACGISINTYRHWETNATTPTKENLLKLREVLDF